MILDWNSVTFWPDYSLLQVEEGNVEYKVSFSHTCLSIHVCGSL